MKHFLFCLFILFFVKTHAQYENIQKVDSLLKLLPQSKEDTNKVALYCTLVNDLNQYNVDSAIIIGISGLQLAEKLSWERGLNRLKINIGRSYWRKGNFEAAIKNHSEALEYYKRKKNTEATALLLTFIGQDYIDYGKFADALTYLKQAEVIYRNKGDKASLANNFLLYSFIYSSQGNFSEAIKVNFQALKIYEELGDNYGAGIARGNTADIYISMGNYPEALKLLKESVTATKNENDLVNVISGQVSIGNVYKLMGNYAEALKCLNVAYDQAKEIHDDFQMASAQLAMGEVFSRQSNYRMALQHFTEAVNGFKRVNAKLELAGALCKLGTCQTKLRSYAAAKKSFDGAYSLAKNLTSSTPLLAYYEGVQILDSATGNWQNAYRHYRKYIEIRDSTENLDNTKKVLQQQFQYESEKKDALAQAAMDKKDSVQRTVRNSFAAALAGTLIFLLVLYRQRNKISKARKRSDELLLNILPAEVAEELKAKGSADAKQFDDVTVLFTDFKDFTQLSEKMTPTELIAEINDCFSVFDNIMQKYGVEKIKTIGDAYMAVGGLPTSNKTHAVDVVKAAIEIQQFMLEHKLKRLSEGKLFFEIRIGVHTGPVVAGIVGVRKIAYDIWGDTVNIAARMESSGESGKINISNSTYEAVKHQFNCSYRGKITAKNKGEIDMYFVDGILQNS